MHAAAFNDVVNQLLTGIERSVYIWAMNLQNDWHCSGHQDVIQYMMFLTNTCMTHLGVLDCYSIRDFTIG
jgi:hypothetical protein